MAVVSSLLVGLLTAQALAFGSKATPSKGPQDPTPGDTFLKRMIKSLNFMLKGWSRADKEHKKRGGGLFEFFESIRNILAFFYKFFFGKNFDDSADKSNDDPAVTSAEVERMLRKDIVRFVKLSVVDWSQANADFYNTNRHEIFKYLRYLRKTTWKVRQVRLPGRGSAMPSMSARRSRRSA